MFKFKVEATEVWIRPDKVISIEHGKTEVAHAVTILLEHDVMYTYTPASEEDCRQFLFDLFEAMGYQYKYQG